MKVAALLLLLVAGAFAAAYDEGLSDTAEYDEDVAVNAGYDEDGIHTQ